MMGKCKACHAIYTWKSSFKVAGCAMSSTSAAPPAYKSPKRVAAHTTASRYDPKRLDTADPTSVNRLGPSGGDTPGSPATQSLPWT